MAVGNSIVTILWRATIIMFICWWIGRALGAVAQTTVEDHITQYKQRHPIPREIPPELTVSENTNEAA